MLSIYPPKCTIFPKIMGQYQCIDICISHRCRNYTLKKKLSTFLLFKDLFIWKTAEGRHRDLPFTWFTLKMAEAARTEQDQSWGSGTSSGFLIWMIGAQIVKLSFIVFPGAFAGSWIESRAAGASVHIECFHHKWQLKPPHHNASPFTFILAILKSTGVSRSRLFDQQKAVFWKVMLGCLGE